MVITLMVGLGTDVEYNIGHSFRGLVIPVYYRFRRLRNKNPIASFQKLNAH